MDREPINSERDLLGEFLAHRDAPCPGCGYNLRGLREPRCPECNQPLRMSVALVEPALGLWLAAVLGLGAVGAGALFMLLGVVILSVSESRWRWPRGEEFVLLVLIPAAVLVVDGLAVWWLGARRGRRWFRSLTMTRRAWVAAACWGLSLSVFAGWLYTLVQVA